MTNNLTLPDELLHSALMLVSIRTRMILDLTAMDDDQKKLAIDDMVERQMKSLRLSSEYEATR